MFSKLILKAVAISYFIGLVSGLIFMIILAINGNYDLLVTSLEYTYVYIGSPVAIAIGFYEWKAKHENVVKITQGLSSNQSTESYATEYFNQNSQSSEIIDDNYTLDQILADPKFKNI